MADRENENVGPRLLGISIIMIAIATLFVVLRFWSRYLKGKIYWWDDWTALAALPFVYACCGINAAQIQHGLGRHMSTLPAHDATMVVRIEYAFEWVYPSSLGIIKVSVLLLYYRVFGRTRLNPFLWMAGAMAVAWVAGMYLSNLLQCRPLRKAWDPSVPGHCFNSRTFFIANSACNISNDALILTLPLPILWHQPLMPVKQKMLLSLTFLLGALVVAASVYRFVTLLAITEDITWTFSYPNLWSVIEPAVALVSSCLPTMNILYLKLSHLVRPTQGQPQDEENQREPGDSGQTESTLERIKRKKNPFAQWGQVLSTFRSEVRTSATRTSRSEVRNSHGGGPGWGHVASEEFEMR